MAKLADAQDLKSCPARGSGSTPDEGIGNYFSSITGDLQCPQLRARRRLRHACIFVG